MSFKVMITGATGYLGGNILKTLIKNPAIGEIAVLVHNKPLICTSSKEKLYTSNQLSQAVHGSKFIIHFAAEYLKGTDITSVNKLIDSDLRLTSNIFSLAQNEVDCRVIMPTTFSMLDNSQNLVPKTFYAATKAFAELTANLFDVKYTFLRLPDTFGPNDNRHKLIQIINDSYKNKNRLVLDKNRNFEMNVISVRDITRIVNFIIHHENRPSKETLDLFYPENVISMGEIVDFIDPTGDYISCSPIEHKQEIVLQKHILPGYKIKSPIRKEFQKVLGGK